MTATILSSKPQQNNRIPKLKTIATSKQLGSTHGSSRTVQVNTFSFFPARSVKVLQQRKELMPEERELMPEERRGQFFAAAKSGDLKTVEEIINSGAMAQVKDWYGNTPLHVAAAGGHLSVVEALSSEPLRTSKKTDINAKNKFRQTPLHYASLFQHKEILKSLLELPGIEGNAQDKSGDSILHLGADMGDPFIRALLKPKF